TCSTPAKRSCPARTPARRPRHPDAPRPARTRPTARKETAMPDTLRKVSYFHATIPDKPGRGAAVMRGLAEAGVNLVAFSAFPSGKKSQLDFFAADSAALK